MTAEVTNSLPNCASNESATEGNRAFSGRAGLKPLPIRRGGKADPASLPRDFATGIPLLTHAETDVQPTMNALRAELADARQELAAGLEETAAAPQETAQGRAEEAGLRNSLAEWKWLPRALHNSTPWRITGALRRVVRLLRTQTTAP